MRRAAATMAAVVAALGLVACGVRVDASPQPVPSGALPAPSPTASPTDSPTDVPARTVRLWFVREDGLVPVLAEFPGGDEFGPASIISGLTNGPDAAQSEEGVRTVVRDPLTEESLVSVPEEGGITESGSVIVIITPEVAALPPGEQVLMLGQVVLSITGAGYPSVAFVDSAGSPAAVPLPGGRLLDRPAVARDYAGLIIEL